MAVHLERPLPREPFPGKRHRRRVLALGALLAFGGFGLLAPAHAQDGSLSAGTSAFTAGKYDATVRMMTGVLQGDKVDPSEAAKALYLPWARLSEAQTAHPRHRRSRRRHVARPAGV